MEHKEGKKQLIRTAGRKIIQKSEDRLRSLWDISKHTNIRKYGCQKEKRKNKKLILFEKIMKENFLNLVKEMDI